LASYFGSVQVVLVLLNAGAHASAENTRGQTSLHLVSQCPHHSRGDGVGVVQLLLKHGADVNAQDNNHATPSDFASHYGRTEIASLLLNYGGKVSVKIDQHPMQRQLGLKRVQFNDSVTVFEDRVRTLSANPKPAAYHCISDFRFVSQ
jgi:ankyrin repeat protein